MRKIKISVKRKTLEQLYFSFIRPILEYASVVWDGCTLYQKNELEKIQNEAARIVTGLTRSVSLETLYSEINWMSLSNRREYQKLVLLYKITHNITPKYLTDLFPETVSNLTEYPLRNALDFQIINQRTELFSKSFIPSAISLWNSIDNNIRSLDTLSKFKSTIKNSLFNVNQIPEYFHIGSRFYSVIHTRLRNRCSNLNHDLFCNHLHVNGNCKCGAEREDSEHYFFKCRYYAHYRISLFRSLHHLHPLCLNLLLFGSPNLNAEENRNIFLAVQKFIKDSNRFKV
jgi:hypothetical protein